MASTDTTARPADDGPGPDGGAASESGPAHDGRDLAGLEAGLDALESAAAQRPPLGRTLLSKAVPPLVAVALVLVAWQLAYHFQVKAHYLLPSPADVIGSLHEKWLEGTLLGYVWTSLSRGVLGFLASLVLGTALGLVVARVRPVRAALGPILSGLQSLPSVAWVPAAIIWFGLTNASIYAVVLLGAVPSIANGLVAGVDQIPPLFLRAGRTIGATGLRGVRHVLMPAALPGYLAGLKQGWAFSWRSLMAAELIVNSPDLGTGLGQFLEQGREQSDMAWVLAGILLILVVGIGIELLVFAPLERWVLRSRGLLAGAR
ncbi:MULTISPECIES: ABC transporter permease [Streptomycetaceae]|uniref:Transport system integral membrane protein n=1 Tax=Streptantibioticus cattleyicolor (strain ATCC 35852 / DSM 46488 / JCM 4925 / NBRC 14057 / NRRL 8057) TaxID=1003195 RepID=F8JQQ3_STREN|nr:MULTISPECIES: ABC transporter permease [Streptomycetaceae]AEW97086.1 transport system integral membrane protein [Streptantibioticus cattleyicolor NRRL 8057 = DSM 46488]MYS61547.1 ABC transporter permease subunit [Streptomyces sp. SID5468]CCB77409.1 putative transport system integral membrane protein [Streptantibioticus cattleyicolor NRRL 8057 = DSM 46488]